MSEAFRVVGAFCAFGKLPSHADFLSIGPGSALFTRFSDWLTSGVEWAHASKGATWAEAFRVGTLRAFAFRGDVPGMEHSLVVGTLAPSRDQAGRLFPICVAASVIPSAEFVTHPHLLPFACENIWQLAGESLTDSSSYPDANLGARLAALPEPSVARFSEAAAAYAGWCEALSLSELRALIAESEQVDALRWRLQLISEAVQPHRKQELPSTRLSLRLPLGAAGGAAVCFWLDVVRRLVGWHATMPSVFWSQDRGSGQLVLHLGLAPVGTVSQLWLPDTQSNEFWDLSQPLPSTQALSPLPAAVEQALRDQTSSVATLLAALDIYD
ncbi:MAG TPA: type VI secretion system-associated protein TagF [Polyangiaceae bacterium]|nr:type VI secretion system-associated protein TagF [Polyangiaceae bacterium]